MPKHFELFCEEIIELSRKAEMSLVQSDPEQISVILESRQKHLKELHEFVQSKKNQSTGLVLEYVKFLETLQVKDRIVQEKLLSELSELKDKLHSKQKAKQAVKKYQEFKK